ncbi:MAG: DNA-binding protein WhiA [Chloroflexota bacterium]|nr:DNA-binding protein WhiA [Chloroflexota bacterium]
MLVAGAVKGELARIIPARTCCRRAELAGLLANDRGVPGLSTFDHGTARITVQLASSLGLPYSGPHAVAAGENPLRQRTASGSPTPAAGRHHLQVRLDPSSLAAWSWDGAPACDRRAFLRGVVLAGASVSLTSRGPHVEFVFRSRSRAETLRRRLAESGVRGSIAERRGRWVVYLKGRDEIAALLRLTGANRGLLDFETGRVGSEVGNRLNRLINAEEANLGRTVRAADRQLQAIRQLETSGVLGRLPQGLRMAAAERRLQPEADLDTLAEALGVSRSATNHRLRKLVELADEVGAAQPPRPRRVDR